ncbi:hypothetical protein AL515_23030 [Citrobacter sp. FDAARGOS_156]|nr:hypothetical protein AL515_23030 [Citrobacter sp. FDAARGOS_156]
MFTQDFFTENATHKQNCTSFNPNRVITYNVNNGKPFLNVSRSVAQITQFIKQQLHSYAPGRVEIYPRLSPLAPAGLRRSRDFSTIAHQVQLFQIICHSLCQISFFMLSNA